jgi:hypothetical protein
MFNLFLNLHELVTEQLLISLLIVHELHEALSVVLCHLVDILVEMRPFFKVLQDICVTDCR